MSEAAEKRFTSVFKHKCDLNCPHNCWRKLLAVDTRWICHTCDRRTKLGSMPPQAMANNLQLSKITPKLSQLNALERQLISLRIPFMKLLSLPRGGQKGVKGPIVNVLSNISNVTSSLPSTLNQSQLVKVKLKRKLAHKGHYKYQWINLTNVFRALKVLKARN